MTRKQALTVLFTGTLWIVMSAIATTAMLSQHTGSANPLTEGFLSVGGISTSGPVTNDSGFDAWQVVASGNSGYFYQRLDYATAFTQGWRLTCRVRVVTGSGYAYCGLNTAGDRPRFDLRIQNVGADAVVIMTQNIGLAGPSYTVTGGAGRWLLLEMVYDPTTTKASLSVDGLQRLTGYAGWLDFRENRGVLFGSGGTIATSANFNLVRFDVPASNSAPTLTSLSPSSAGVGGPALTLMVNGSQFVSGSQVLWNGSPRPTTFVSDTKLTAAIPASDIAATTITSITVVNPAPVGGTSNAVPFMIAPTMALDKTKLIFGAVTSGTAFLFKTSAQTLRLTQNGSGNVTWTATSNQPWLHVTPASGTGSATLSIGLTFVSGLPSSGSLDGTVTLTFTGAANTLGPIAMRLNLLSGTTAPIGFVDTPVDRATGVTGAVPFTGWAIDDVELARVMICRAAVGTEVAPVDQNCAGQAQIFVGFPVFIDLARPDIAVSYPEIPLNTRAGWGFMVLTNMLPRQGNGTFVFYMWAEDREGNTKLLGTRTVTCDNAHATKPFGSLDTPEQGGVASGSAYVNFGWTLTPLPKSIPPDGSTISVLVDGAPVGVASYNHFRGDIASFFPGLNNTNGAIGFRVLDTTTLTNGTHTISWTVVDDHGSVEGIGSRFFSVSNGTPAGTASTALTTTSERGTSGSRYPSSSLRGRRGWDLAAPLETFEPDGAGRVVVRSEEVNRVEVHLGEGLHVGHLRTSEGLSPLPVGSRIDPATGVFTWAPGVGFVGAYDLVFTSAVGRASGIQREVRIVLHPKGSHLTGPQVVIDAPRSQQDVGQPFVLGGWAADLNAASGTGISTLHAWAYPLTGGPPVFLGATAYGGSRPDVASVHGHQFESSGFGLHVQGLTPGNYDLAVFGWSTLEAKFVNAAVVRATIR